MQIKQGIYQVWPGFSLELKQDILFKPGVYQLQGENGTGKSSLYKKLLLPALQAESDKLYILYIEQMMKGQFYALKAHAALSGYTGRINTESECVDYLLQNLEKALAQNKIPVFAMVDESTALKHILDRLQVLQPDFTLIFSSHRDEGLVADHYLSLSLMNPERSFLLEQPD